MFKLNEKEINFIKSNFNNADELLSSDNIQDLLDELDELIMYEGFDINYDLNDFGREAQRIYDDIYYNNK